MSVKELDEKAHEEGSFTIKYVFEDEEGNSLTPNSDLQWTLTDAYGNVVNSRSGVNIASAATIYITLSGDDLKTLEHGNLTRVVTLTGTYNSNRGNNLALVEEVRFDIEPILNVP